MLIPVYIVPIRYANGTMVRRALLVLTLILKTISQSNIFHIVIDTLISRMSQSIPTYFFHGNNLI